MSKKVDICDLCQSRYPEYHFRYKAIRWFHSIYGSVKDTYDICDDCWGRLVRLSRKKKGKS